MLYCALLQSEKGYFWPRKPKINNDLALAKFVPMNKAEGSTRNSFFHNTVNITEWMKERVSKLLEDKGHVLISLDLNAEVMTRMSHLTVINNINLQTKDKHGDMHFLNNYSSISKEYDGDKDTRWLVDAIKEAEAEALLKFGGKALQTEVQDAYQPRVVDVGSVGLKDTDDIKIVVYFSAAAAELAQFLGERQFIERWTGGSARFEGTRVVMENVILDAIEYGDEHVAMQYKWADWAEPSSVDIALLQAGDCVKLTLVQRGVPTKDAEIVKHHWHEKIFYPISRMFNCAIKQI